MFLELLNINWKHWFIFDYVVCKWWVFHKLALLQVFLLFVFKVEGYCFFENLLCLWIKYHNTVKTWSCPLSMNERFFIFICVLRKIKFLYIILKWLEPENINHYVFFNCFRVRMATLNSENFEWIKLCLRLLFLLSFSRRQIFLWF